MKPEESNRVIAEYMGDQNYGLWSRDLNALVPVWQKLDKTNINFARYKIGWQCHVDDCVLQGTWYSGKTMAEAAAIATAKAIQELNA